MSLVSRHLEAHGIPTVIIGSALDIVEHCGVARYLHSNFPLGNPCGLPDNKEMQLAIIKQALVMFENSTHSNTTERTPFQWNGDPNWQDDYSRVDDSNREELLRRGAARRKQQEQHKAAGLGRAAMISET